MRQLDDPVVRARFSRIFHLSPEMVRLAFSRMHLTRMPTTTTLQVWYVHPGERIGYKVLRVRKGTPIFALPDGTPALIQICGNPMRADIPNPIQVLLPSATQRALPGLPATAKDFDLDDDTLPPYHTPPQLTLGPLREGGLPEGVPPAEPPDFVESTEPLPPGPLPTTPTMPVPVQLPSIATDTIEDWLKNAGMVLFPVIPIFGPLPQKPSLPGPVALPKPPTPIIIPKPPLTPEPGPLALALAAACTGLYVCLKHRNLSDSRSGGRSVRSR